MKMILTIAALLLGQNAPATATSVSGVAPFAVGSKVRILQYEDYITKKTAELAVGQVEADSTFQIDLDLDKTIEAILEVGDVFSYIYLQPNGNYKLLIPDAEDGRRLNRNFVQLIFEEMPPEDDINFQVLDFNYRLDGFMNTRVFLYYDSLHKDSVFSLTLAEQWYTLGEEWIDTLQFFKTRIADIYADEKNSFFINHMMYTIATMEASGNAEKARGVNQEMVYHRYLEASPIFYDHPAYMQLLNSMYKNIIGGLPQYQQRRIFRAIVMEDADSLKHIFSEHALYTRPELTELILLKGLGEAYVQDAYPRTSILNLLDKLSRNASVKRHKAIAKNVVGKLTKLQRGYPAPEFSLSTSDGDTASVQKYRGRYLYLTFFETWCVECASEFKIMKTLRERYGDHVEMLSICMDEDAASLKKFLKKHDDLDWAFAHGGADPRLREYYDLVAYPSYVLIDPEGNILQAPALTPSPTGNYESIDRTMYNISQSLRERDVQAPPTPPGGFRPPRQN